MTVNNLAETKFSGRFDGRTMTLDAPTALAPLATRYEGVFTDDNTVALTTTGFDRRSFVVRRRTT